MKSGNIITFLSIFLCSSLILAEDYTPEQKQELGQKIMHEMLQEFFYKAMEAKRAFQSNQFSRNRPCFNFLEDGKRETIRSTALCSSGKGKIQTRAKLKLSWNVPH